MFAATRMFASNLNPKAAQRFYNLVLLPRVEDDINEEKKLNYHLYMALKKALYKPVSCVTCHYFSTIVTIIMHLFEDMCHNNMI